MDTATPALPHTLRTLPGSHATIRAQRLMRDASLREKVFEHLLLGSLGVEMIERGVDMTVLHAEVDHDGYDIVLVADGVTRHVQLKVTIVGGARTAITVNTRLMTQPSGCVVWLSYNPASRNFSAIRWFGDGPGMPLPNPGAKVARHSRANSNGVKAHRDGHRVLAASRFDTIEDIAHLSAFRPATSSGGSTIVRSAPSPPRTTRPGWA